MCFEKLVGGGGRDNILLVWLGLGSFALRVRVYIPRVRRARVLCAYVVRALCGVAVWVARWDGLRIFVLSAVFVAGDSPTAGCLLSAIVGGNSFVISPSALSVVACRLYACACAVCVVVAR